MRSRLLGYALGMAALAAGSASGQAVLWTESFDGVTVPAMPAGWLVGGEGWETSSSSAGPGSGGNNLMHQGTVAGAAESPSLDLSAVTSGDLVFLARRTGSYDAASLQVLASADGGATYPITLLGPGAALPVVDSQYESMRVTLPVELIGEPDVRIRFEGLGGGSAFASARIDDVSLEGVGLILQNQVGFGVERDTVLSGSEDFSVPLVLQLADAPAGLQGLQLSVRFDTAAVRSVQIAPGPAISSDPLWRLDSEIHDGMLRIVLLGEGTTVLPQGSYDPLLWLGVLTEEVTVSIETALELEQVIASQGDPEGTTLTLASDPAILALRVEAGTAAFQASPDTVDMGVVRAGGVAQASVEVSNTGGTIPLVIDSVETSNPMFTVDPVSATLAPDEAISFTVTASPLLADVGIVDAEALFHHNAAGGFSVIPLLATVVSGRGDLNADGVVDILDLVLGIDLVLGRIDSTQVDIVAADLFPFPAGDGVSDVRDLTVLSQAIGRDQWPDGVPLDATTPAAKTQSNLFADATVVLERGPSALSVRLESAEPFRALHVVLDLPEAMRSKTVALETGTVEGATLAATPRWDDGSLSLMLYRMDGRALGAGEFDLVRIPVGTGDLDTTVRRALVVNARLERAVARTAVRLSDDTPSVPEHRTGIDAPFPVPLVPGTGLVHLPVRLDDDENGRLEIYDVRGALIRLLYEGEMAGGSTTWMWDGTDRNDRPVAPGVYFVRLQTISQIDHRAVVVTR